MFKKVYEFNFKVEGMMCAHCQMRVEKAVKSVKGVKVAEANFESGSLIVKADENKIDDIIKAVSDEGYTIELEK